MTSADADRGRREDPDTATFTASRDCIRPDFLSALPASGRTCHLRLRHIGRSIGYETGTRAFEESKVFWRKDMTLHWINARSSKGTLYKFLRDQVVDTPKVIVVNLTIVRHTQLRSPTSRDCIFVGAFRRNDDPHWKSNCLYEYMMFYALTRCRSINTLLSIS